MSIEERLVNEIMAIEVNKNNKKGKKNMKKEVAQEVINQEVVAKEEVKEMEVKKEEVKKAKRVKKEKKNEEKVARPVIEIMTNDELAKLFHDNGCATYTKASNESNVVYNTFGTKSRVLQQKKAYQLLLTNGHREVKGEIIDCENDDTARFMEWYGKLDDNSKGNVVGMDGIMSTALSKSELPRERTVKITNKDLLVNFIQYMATFNENQPIVTAQ